MKRNFRIFLALFMALVFTVSIAGCGTQANTNSSATTAAANAAETTAAAASGETAAKAPEPVTLNIMTEMNTGITSPGVQDDQVAMEIQKQTGITMNIENVEGNLIVPKVSAMIASGDLPDLFVYDCDKPTLKTLIDSDSFYDITDVADSKLTNWMKNDRLKFVLNFSKEYLSQGKGRLYNIPLCNGLDGSPASLTAGAFIRWDLYKELGYPKVTDIMDVLPVLKQMLEKHPKTAEGKPAYGVSFWTDWAHWPVSVFGFVDGYGEGNEFGSIDISNEKFMPYTDDNSIFWKYTKFYNKASQMGILDPDSYTLKQEQWAAKVTAGQEYFMITGWLTNTWKGQPDQGYGLLDTTGDSDKAYANWKSDIGTFYGISKNSKNADRALDFINYLADENTIRMLHNGVQGQTWDIVDGKPQYKDGILALVDDPNNTDAKKYGYGKYNKLAAFGGGEKDANGLYYNFRFDPEFVSSSLTNMEKDNAKFYNVTIPSDIYNRKKYTQYGNVLTSAIPAIEDSSYEQKVQNIAEYFSNNWIQLVKAKDDAAYDAAKAKFIKDVKDMGFDEVLEKYMKVYNETKAKLDSLK